MARPGKKVHIVLPEKEAVDTLLRVKPIAGMPKPGGNPTKPKKKPKKRK